MINFLAEPFAHIFVDRAEADWAFDLLRDAIRRLRVHDPYDPRVALTLPRQSGRYFLHLNFGGWLVLGFRGPGSSPERVDMSLLAQLVTWDERLASLPFERKEGEPEVRSYALPLDMLRPMPSHWQHAFETTLDFVADKFAAWKKATRWKHHNPELIEACFDLDKRAQLFAAGLTDLELRYERTFTAFGLTLAEEEGLYETGDWRLEIGDEEMTINKEKIQELIACIRQKYPNWESFSDPDFNRDEIDYKQATVKKAQGLLNRDSLKQLLDSGEFDEFVDRLDKIGKDNNLLWRSVPLSGDLNILYQDTLDKPSFCETVFDLLYGPEDSPQRIERYLAYVQNHDLPNKWTFPTYLLFCCYPDTEIFIKPQATRNFLRFFESQKIFSSSPTGDSYAQIREFVNQLKDDLKQYQPRDMIDLQSIIWVCSAKVIDREIDEKQLAVGIDDDETPIYPSPNLQSPISPPPRLPAFPLPLSQIAEETGLDESELERWVRAIERKGQAIFYGPPGTGKTFIAQKLAAHLIGGGDGFVELVQFHPAYAYEDFIQGIRPTVVEGQLSYDLKLGRFLEFCRRAEDRDTCVLIIDEINRANLARVFGELMVLLEYRNQEIPLAGGGNLRLPANIRLIGTMNTADRSIALVDHALRRRFAFIALTPNFEALRRYHRREQTGFPVESLVAALTSLNKQIDDPHYQVGITFFLRPNLAVDLPDIWQMEIEPYLEEYFFNQRDKLDDLKWPVIKAKFNL